MSLVSLTTDSNSTKPKTEPTAAAEGRDVVGGIIHLTIPIVIPLSAIRMQGIDDNEVPSVVAPPLVMAAGGDTKTGSSSAIKAEHNDEPSSTVPGVATIDTKTFTHPGSMSTSIDIVKGDTTSAIQQAMKEGKDVGGVQKFTKQKKHMWKGILTRAGMNKTDFKRIWAEVRQHCEEKHHRDNTSANSCGASSSSACKSEDGSSNSPVGGAEVAVKAEPTEIVEQVAEEECNVHVPLKKRKLPLDYAPSIHFDQILMSSTVIKKPKIDSGSNSNDEAAAAHPDEENSITVNIKEEEEEEEEEPTNTGENEMAEEGNNGSSTKTAPNSWKCHRCKEKNEVTKSRCKSCYGWKGGHRLWTCKRCSERNEGRRQRCSVCTGWKNGHRPPSNKAKKVVKNIVKKAGEDGMRAPDKDDTEKKSVHVGTNTTSTSKTRTVEGPSLQDVLKALSEGDDEDKDNTIDFDLKMEEGGVGEEVVPPKQEMSQKKKRKSFDFGEWDSIEYFTRV